MRAIAGIFPTLTDGTKAAKGLERYLPHEQINLLTPVSTEEEIHQVPTTEDMPPVSGPLGGILGGALAVGVAVPGIGTVTALGVAAIALVGATGGIVGWKIGEVFDRFGSSGLPVDELYVYEDALRQGRTVVIALVEDEAKEDEVRRELEDCGAESVDSARHKWWLGLRDAEAAAYDATREEFERDEAAYRRGFESALLPSHRGRSFEAAADDLRRHHPHHHEKLAFRRGYERGQAYLRHHEESPPPQHP